MELLNEFEVRVIGSLIEKKLTTPEYYPLSLNALVNACNQKSSREPVVSYSEDQVFAALNSLREKKLARLIQDGGRVNKFKESFIEELKLDEKQAAALTVLMLRGSQTSGEIRTRSGRLYDFPGLEEVDNTLQELMMRSEGALVMKLDRQTGMKERRYAHLLSGVPLQEEKNIVPEKEDKLSKLESELENLKAETESLKMEIESLKNQFSEFKKQFE